MDVTPGTPSCLLRPAGLFLHVPGARTQPSFPLALQPSLIFFTLRPHPVFTEPAGSSSKRLRTCSPLPPVPTLTAPLSVKLTSNWSPCFCPSYSALEEPFEMDNQISLCLQTDAHAQLDPAGRPLTRCYSRWDAVIPCYPSSAAFIAAPQTEPLSPNPHSLRVSGRCSSFLPPPTRRLVSQLSSPGKTLHLLDIFNELHLTVFTCLILRFPWRRRPWVPRLRDPSLRWAPRTAPSAHADQAPC